MSEKELSKEVLTNPETKTEMIRTVIERIEPRYVGYSVYSQEDCDLIREDFKEQNKIWTMKHSREGFECLDTKEDWEPEGNSVEADILSFQKYLDKTYGRDKYEAYAIGAYIHSDVSFAFNKGADKRCQWDSGTIGFVGINKEVYVLDNLSEVARELSDAWNGYITVLGVYDNYNQEQLETILSTESQFNINRWKETMKEQYNITEYPQQD